MRSPHRSTAMLALMAAAVGLAGCTSAQDPPTSTTTDATVDASSPTPSTTTTGQDPVSTVATGLEVPWSIAFDGDVALLSERDSARILELDAEGSTREVATLDAVTPSGEGGLLGLAVHEQQLYVYLTAGQENRVERYPLTGVPGSLALGPATTILDGIPAARNHNGGRIAVGPDGMLYITAGDAGDRDSAQDLDALSGKILRVTLDGQIPDDNPFPGSAVYSFGHRNPQGLAWDADGTLYASEFGQDTWDELNVIEPGGNYGWPVVEGIAADPDYLDLSSSGHPTTPAPAASPSTATASGSRTSAASA